MSSHHIVRDKQEPALLIANGDVDVDLLNELLEWSPFVLCCDGAAHFIHSLGIKIDGIIGDFDSVEGLDEIIQAQQPVKVMHLPDQNSTDLEKGIEYLINDGHFNVNILGATGKRTDHSLNNLSSICKYSHQIGIIIYDKHGKISVIKSGFSKWYTAGHKLSLLPIGKCTDFRTSNLKYPIDGLSLELGIQTSSSNQTQNDGIVEIHFSGGPLLLFEMED